VVADLNVHAQLLLQLIHGALEVRQRRVRVDLNHSVAAQFASKICHQFLTVVSHFTLSVLKGCNQMLSSYG
jgi:hypothetical protein